jgi:hypothetical protein
MVTNSAGVTVLKATTVVGEVEVAGGRLEAVLAPSTSSPPKLVLVKPRGPG